MTIDEFVLELKVYLKIKETDIENDALLKQSAMSATGFIIGAYAYYILADTVSKELVADSNTQQKFYLNAGPTTNVVAYLNDIEVTDNANKTINNIAYFESALGLTNDFIKLTSTVGIDPANTIAYGGDLANACALAAYFFKQADKGLDGVMQYGTGIKESARLYEGIPRGITQYFETRNVFRL